MSKRRSTNSVLILVVLSVTLLFTSCSSSRQESVESQSPAGTPPSSTTASTSEQDVRAILEAFLKAWHKGDRAGMLHYATPDAIDNFDNVNSDDPQQLTYELVWSDQCLLGPMASGTCEFLVHKPGPGHALIYSLHYLSTPEGLKIDQILPGGDAG
jgi:hypothetical protein